MPVTDSGKFRDRVQFIIRNEATAPNELGETIATDTTTTSYGGSWWAWVKPIESKEVTQNAETVLELTHEVRLKYGSELTATLAHTDAILYRGRTLEIYDIRNDDDGWEGSRELVLTCKEYRPLS